MPFVKLDCGIIHSSLWAESSDTRICWITLLVLADQAGFVRAAASAIARQAGISAEATRKALELFASPDDESRSPENKGKRIEAVEGGYKVLNYSKYRERDYGAAARMRRLRAKQKNKAFGVTPVTLRNVTSTVTHADADADADADAEHLSSLEKKKEAKKKVRTPPNFSDVSSFFENQQLAQDFWDYYESNGWRVGRNPMKNWKAAASRWSRVRDTNHKYPPQMSPQHRQNRINFLNQKKVTLNRKIKDPNNPPSWATQELAKIDAELKEL